MSLINCCSANKMKFLTKIFISLPIFLSLLGKLLLVLKYDIGRQMVLFSYITLIFLVIYLITITPKRFLFYLIALGLEVLLIIGSLLKMMNWYVGAPMLIIGLLSAPISGVLLIKSSIRCKIISSNYQLILGVIILFQCIILIWLTPNTLNFSKLLNYLIVGLSGTILLNKSSKNLGERNMLVLIFVQGVLFVIKHSFELFKSI
jgi:hypothetical protein